MLDDVMALLPKFGNAPAGKQGGKSQLIRLTLATIWERFNRGEKAPSVFVVGPGWSTPKSNLARYIADAPFWHIDLD